MVNDLPKQLECPLCLATQKTYVILMKQLKLYVADLEDQLDFYANKQEDAYGCLEVVTSLYDKSREGSGEPLTVDKREELDLKQLELCRLLYTLHFQLLLIFQSFNRLIHAVATSLPQDGKTPDKMIALHKQLLSYEKTKDSPSYNSTAAEELIDAEDDLKSMTNEEALNVLNASLQGSEYKTSQLQLGLLRKLWPMEPFGCQYDSGADFLTSLYFEKSVGAKTDGAAYVIIGENSGSRDLCEKLMEVNMQIQHTLQVLEKPRPHNSSVNESHTKSESSATSSNSHSAQKTSFKKTSF